MPSAGLSDTAGLAAAAPPSQRARLAELCWYGVLDTPVEGAFDDVTRIAAYVCQEPIAVVVNLIDELRQWFKPEIGLGVRETPLETSFCAPAQAFGNTMILPERSPDAAAATASLIASMP